MLFFLIILFLTINLTAMESNNKKTMSEAEIVDAFNKNTNFMIASQFNGMDTVTVSQEDGVSYIHSNIPDEIFNYVFETHLINDSVTAKIKQLIEYYKQKNVPWTWWIGPGDTPDNLEQALTHTGFTKTEEYNGMYCEVKKRNILTHLAKITCKRVGDKSQLSDFYRIHASSEHFDSVWSKMSPKFFEDSCLLEFYIGYADEKPVTAGLLVFHENIAGIYSVATDQKERNKGYATSLMHFLLNRAEEKGFGYAALSASDDVKKLYQNLGFKDICLYRAWKT